MAVVERPATSVVDSGADLGRCKQIDLRVREIGRIGRGQALELGRRQIGHGERVEGRLPEPVQLSGRERADLRRRQGADLIGRERVELRRRQGGGLGHVHPYRPRSPNQRRANEHKLRVPTASSGRDPWIQPSQFSAPAARTPCTS